MNNTSTQTQSKHERLSFLIWLAKLVAYGDGFSFYKDLDKKEKQLVDEISNIERGRFGLATRTPFSNNAATET